MKNMHFPQRFNNPYRRTRRRGLFIGAAGIVCFCLIVLALVRPPALVSAILSLGRPFHLSSGTVAAATGAFFQSFQSNESLVRENADLKDQLARERVKANLYDHLSGIRTQPLEATSTPGLRAVVLATPPFSPYDSLVLSLGGLDGVQPGDVVLYSDAVALGTVSAVAPHAATVTLYSTSGHEESVRIGENGFLTVARGLGGGMFQMSVPKETPLLQGDGVFLPDGMMLGSVRTITESDSDAFSTVTARLPVNLFELRTVYVVPSLSTPL